MIAKKDTYKMFADLKASVILGRQKPDHAPEYIQHEYRKSGKTVSYDSYQNAFIDLKNGRIDGVFGHSGG